MAQGLNAALAPILIEDELPADDRHLVPRPGWWAADPRHRPGRTAATARPGDPSGARAERGTTLGSTLTLLTSTRGGNRSARSVTSHQRRRGSRFTPWASWSSLTLRTRQWSGDRPLEIRVTDAPRAASAHPALPPEPVRSDQRRYDREPGPTIGDAVPRTRLAIATAALRTPTGPAGLPRAMWW